MEVVATSLGTVGVVERGSGPRTPIIFLHGVGSDKSVWAPQIEHFSQSRRSAALDYPGYGESEFIPHATRDDFARSMLAAMDSLGIAKAHICGLSLGGVIAIAIHAISPERCASLVLADTFAVHPDGTGIHDRSIEASRSIGMRALAEARAGTLLGCEAADDIREQVIATMSRIEPAAYALGAEAVWLADQSDRVAAIGVPTLIIVGAEDRITPPELSQELAAMIPEAQLELIDGAGHLANIEKPNDFNRAIAAFLAKID